MKVPKFNLRVNCFQLKLKLNGKCKEPAHHRKLFTSSIKNLKPHIFSNISVSSRTFHRTFFFSKFHTMASNNLNPETKNESATSNRSFGSNYSPENASLGWKNKPPNARRAKSLKDIAEIVPHLFRMPTLSGRKADEVEVYFMDQKEPEFNELKNRYIRSASDSWIQLILPFSRNEQLRARYQLFDSEYLRVGMTLENMDVLAGDVAHRHGGYDKSKAYVTASVDRIHFKNLISSKFDLMITGGLTYVGNSSMEICVTLDSLSSDGEIAQHIGEAYFIMVCRENDKSASVNGLIPFENDSNSDKYFVETSIWSIKDAEKRKNLREARIKRSFLNKPPNLDEISIIHSMFLEDTGKKQEDDFEDSKANSLRMSETKMQSTYLMHRQDRNVHGKMFGGHLMRVAYELAWANSRMMTGCIPNLLCMDDISFIHPVEVGSILQLNSKIQFTDPKTRHLVIGVEARVMNPETNESTITNTFHYVFYIPEENTVIKSIRIDSYDEAMTYLDGRRRFLDIKSE